MHGTDANHLRMLSILDANPDPVYVADPESHEMLYANQALESAVGVSDNRKCYEYLHHRSSPCPFCTNDKILGENFGKTYIWEFQNEVTRRWYRCLDRGITWPDGRIVRYEMAIDITDRKRAEEESGRLASVIRHSTELVNLAAPDGTMIFLNDTGKKMLGISEENVAKTNLMSVIPEHFKDMVRDEVLTSIAGKGHWEGDLQYLNLETGGLTDVHAITFKIADPETDDLQFFANVSQDITGRKRAEEDLHIKDRAIATSFNAIVISDFDGKLTYVNDAFLHMWGYTLQEALKLNVADLDSNRDEILHIVKDIRVKGFSIGESVAIRKDKTLFNIQYSASLVTSSANEPIAMLSTFLDITGRKRAEEEKLVLQDQLIQAQKLEAVGRLAGGVAHDFNNMLGVIIGNMELALEQPGLSPLLRTSLEETRDAAERSAELTRQLLAFARKQTVVPKILDLNVTVEGMLKMLRRLIGEDIDLAWIPDCDLWPIKIDSVQIDQILVNLSLNARDAIEGVGKVTIETKNVPLNEAYCGRHAGFVPGEYVMLAVSDDGRGMDHETLANIFEPFFTTKTLGKGTGLGLATVYGIVKQNNGFINSYSEPGKGTTLKIYLPRYTGRPDRVPVKGVVKNRVTAEKGGTETILLVEDEAAILNMTKAMLENLGYTVLPTGNPGEAIRLAEERAGEIFLLMTDVVMPEMDGCRLANKLRSLFPNLKCLFMSGYTANVIAHHGVLDEGVHFIQKPFSMKGLATKVREALDEK